MAGAKTTFALLFGNRGFFPASLQHSARAEVTATLSALGHDALLLPEDLTNHGAVETPADGEKYAAFLRENADRVGGVILCLPNFGDETGAVSALKDCGVPILVQAYPDELDKMAPELRRDAFCGKFSVMDVFTQYGLQFTALPPHTVHPESDLFAANVDYFDRLCRVVGGMSDMTVGAIGARTTAFKTVRIDELALQRHGITMETVDLATVFYRMAQLDAAARAVQDKAEALRVYTCWDKVPGPVFDRLVRLSVVVDELIDELGLNALAIRCWLEMQEQLGMSPCVLLSELNDRGITTACEVDIGNAVTMFGLSLASGKPAICLDWNNNYGDDMDKCILFHCGSVAQSLMTAKGTVSDHAILANAVGEGCSYGCNEGRIAPTPFTYGSMLTEDGELCYYLGEGEITEDSIPDDFFGCAGVAAIDNLQEKLQTIGYLGHRHHTSITPGRVAAPVLEAWEKYLGYDVTLL